MSGLLEILGRGMTISTTELILHWLNVVKTRSEFYSPGDEFGEILELLCNMDFVKADEKLRFYLFENPSCTLGRMAAGAISLHNNQLQSAIDNLQSVYLREPNNTMALYALGHCYERLEREAQAVEFYQDCLKFKHYLQLPRQRLAAIYFKNGQLQKTINQYELLVNEYPDDISSLVTLGNLYITTGKYSGAIETFNKAILIHPDNFHASEQSRELELLIQKGSLQEAAEHIHCMVAEQDDNADLNVKLADVYAMMGEHTEAIVYYEKALRTQPNYLEAAVKLGTQHLKMHHYIIAAQQFNNAVEINDQIVDAYLDLAVAQKLAGKSSEALATLSLASAIQPNSNLLFGQAATLQLKAYQADTQQGQSSAKTIDTVIEAHRTQLRQHPGNGELHYRYGLLLMGIGRIAEAIAAFQNALNINSNYHRALGKLILCLYETDDRQLALDRLTQSDQLDKEILELHYKTAILYCDKARFTAAMQNLQRSFRENFTSTDAAVNIFVVLQNIGLLAQVTQL